MWRGGHVAFVFGESIAGKLAIKIDHEAVARDFGDDAGGGDGITAGVAIDEGSLGMFECADVGAVDQSVFGAGGELGERFVHGFERGAQDVDAVDSFDGNDGDAELDFGMRGEKGVETFSIFGFDLLGIV